ncbi:MAG: hypothetical protein FWH03_01835 [Firmicutes bacterium]|nr:hypothetical protein [Bacillota bacterium]
MKKAPKSEVKKEEKPVYMMCPRCELNYIAKKDKLCKVCKAEVGLIDASILIPAEEEVEKLCPVCSVNYIGEDETICFLCQKEREKKSVVEDEWEELEQEPEVEEEPEEELDMIVPEGVLDEEEEEEEEEDFSEQYKEPDDFVYDDIDENDFLREDEDFDEDEDEDDDDDFVIPPKK